MEANSFPQLAQPAKQNLMNILSLISEEEGGQDACSVVCTYPNTTDTIHLHRWHQHGKKRVKAEDGQHYEKLYYKCAISSCKARYTAHLVGPQRKVVQCKEDHCHEMENKKKKQEPGDPLQNVIGKYGKTFVHSLAIFPVLYAHCFDQTTLNLLSDATVVGICTCNVGQSSLLLTSVVVYVQSSGAPVAWLLHSSKEVSPFKKFIKAIQKSTFGNFKPKCAVLEFEDKTAESIKDAWIHSIPDSTVREDLQHFEQSNVRWLNEHGLKDRIAEALQDLRRVWFAETTNKQAELDNFFRNWQSLPSFLAFFRKKWMDEVPVEYWGKLDSVPNIPPGILGEYRTRVRTQVLAGVPKKATLDRVVDALHDELLHWRRVGSSSEATNATKIL